MRNHLGRKWTLLLGIVLIAAMFGSTRAEESWVRQIQTPQYFAVSVEDVDRSVDWYCKTLGMKKLDDSKAEDGRWRIANLANDVLSVELIWDKRDSVTERARGIRKVGFTVPDVNVIADRVEAALGDRPRVVEFIPHGILILQLRDPDGNVVQLSSPIETTSSAPE